MCRLFFNPYNPSYLTAWKIYKSELTDTVSDILQRAGDQNAAQLILHVLHGG